MFLCLRADTVRRRFREDLSRWERWRCGADTQGKPWKSSFFPFVEELFCGWPFSALCVSSDHIHHSGHHSHRRRKPQHLRGAGGHHHQREEPAATVGEGQLQRGHPREHAQGHAHRGTSFFPLRLWFTAEDGERTNKPNLFRRFSFQIVSTRSDLVYLLWHLIKKPLQPIEAKLESDTGKIFPFITWMWRF